MEEEICVHGVKHPFGVDSAIVALYRLFSRCGVITLLQVSNDCARITFSTSEAAQQAYLRMNGYQLFGQCLHVCMSKSLPVGSISRSNDATPLLITTGTDVSWLEIVLRRLFGICDVHPLGEQCCLIRCKSVADAQVAKTSLNRLCHPRYGVVCSDFACLRT